MEVRREIVLEAPVEEVWAALTEPERLEEWFANDVELDVRPGGEGVFRWGDGDERRADRRGGRAGALPVAALRGRRRRVELELEHGRWGTRLVRDRVLAAVRACARAERALCSASDVFSALADPHRRFVLETLASRGSATATELAAELPVTRQAVAKHLAALADAGLVEAGRHGRETRYRLTPEPLGDALAWIESVGSQWDERLTALRRHLSGVGDAAGG